MSFGAIGPIWLCVSGPRWPYGKGTSAHTGVNKRYAVEVKTDPKMMDLYHDRADIVKHIGHALKVDTYWLFCDGKPVTPANCKELTGYSHNHICDRIKETGLCEVNGKKLTIDLTETKKAFEAKKPKSRSLPPKKMEVKPLEKPRVLPARVWWSSKSYTIEELSKVTRHNVDVLRNALVNGKLFLSGREVKLK